MINSMKCFAVVLTLLFTAGWIPAHADQKDLRLDSLFERLASNISPARAMLLQTEIWNIWTKHEDQDINYLMLDGMEALKLGRLEPAVYFFREMTKDAPDYAEGWNKLATVQFMQGDYEQSIESVDQVLKLEPRHFGALAGMGHNFLALGNREAAIDAYERALEINPHMQAIRIRLVQLKKQKENDAT